MKKAAMNHVSKFCMEQAEAMAPIPKCEDDQAGNRQGEGRDQLKDAIMQTEAILKIPAHLI